MFFLRDLNREISLHPSFFGRQVKDYLTATLFNELEGTCTGEYYIICIIDVMNISPGKVISGTGLATFNVEYRAIVWKPFKGETVDALVTSVNYQGIFSEVGPLTIFISRHLIPSDIKWVGDATPPQYTNGADEVIEKGSSIRVKITGLRSDVGAMFAIGSINDDYYGVPQT